MINNNTTTGDSFAIIGGDCRSIATANQLDALGLEVKVFAFDNAYKFSGSVVRTGSLEETIAGAKYIVLPLPCSVNNEALHTPLYEHTVLIRDLLANLDTQKTIFAGKLNKLFRAELEVQNIPYFDYAEREEFAVLNAIPTAEGALEIAMRELPVTLNNASCLVLGFGRIAKVLAHRLHGLGAHVTVAARRHSDLAWIAGYGYEALPIKELKTKTQKMQVVFNTVPHVILDRETLITLPKDCLIIDLASKPGGADTKFR